MPKRLLFGLAALTGLWFYLRQPCTVCGSSNSSLWPVKSEPVAAMHSPSLHPVADWPSLTIQQRLEHLQQHIRPALEPRLQARSLQLGMPVFLRAFKQTRELELWLKHPQQGWQRWHTYPILAASGTLGPKEKEGDCQVPEGLYTIPEKQLKPDSAFHLAINIGYPNRYDLSLHRTGSFIMIHGSDVSIGCLAMGDPAIEEIYLLLSSAFQQGQSAVSLQLFPARLSPEFLHSHSSHPAHTFWQEKLLPAYQRFEQKRQIQKQL
jgi:murein L,D-transpeptidase YafK